MTKLKIVATIALLLATQPAFARGGGGGGMSHGDHTTMSMTHGQNMDRGSRSGTNRQLTPRQLAEAVKLQRTVLMVEGKILLLTLLEGKGNSRQVMVLNREAARLKAILLHRFGVQKLLPGVAPA